MNADLLSHFSTLTDPRVDRTKRYPLIEIIFLIISATVSGCEGWKAIRDFGQLKLEWLRGFLPYESGIPVDDTIARVMRRIDTKQFQNCFINWMRSVSIATEGDIVAIDGKTVRRSYDKKADRAAIHMVSAWSSANSVVLGQEKTEEKSNEITAIPELLEVLALKGCIVTIDAMGCQKSIAQQILQKKADYVLALKGNQGDFHADVSHFFIEAFKNDFNGILHDFHEENDAGHGRIEQRQCWVINPQRYANCFTGFKKWTGLKGLIMVKTRREMKDKITEDTRFYITSCAPQAKALLQTVRKHWQVENALHWTLDVTFREDESRIRKEASPENYAVIRHIALNLIRKNTSIDASVKRKRLMAALDDNVRSTMMAALI